MRILAVDDDPFIIQVLSLALVALGHEQVVTAQSANEGMIAVRDAVEPFECVLLDIQMPEVDGVEFCAAFRQIPGYQKTPVIMLTAMSERAYIERAFDAGATDYITKPFETVELNARLNMAQTLIDQTRSKEAAERELASVTSDWDFQPAVDLEDALAFDDMPGHLKFHAFKNYLEQLRRGDTYFGELVAVKVANITNVFNRLSGRDFVNFVTDVGDAVADCLQGGKYHFTYAGSGYYLVLAMVGGQARFAEDFFDQLSANLLEMDLCYPDGQPIGVSVCMSEPHTPSRMRRRGVDEMIKAAISDVESKAAEATKVDITGGSDADRASMRLFH